MIQLGYFIIKIRCPLCIKAYYFIEISSFIGSRCFDLCINGALYKRDVDVEDLKEVYSLLRKNDLYIYDIMQSLTEPSKYNLLVEREIKSC